MKKVKTKRYKMLKGEKFMYVLLALLVVAIPVIDVFTNALLSETNIKVEDLESKIDVQLSLNESLSMQLNELASLQNIQSIADEYGLSYVNGNIKVIEGE